MKVVALVLALSVFSGCHGYALPQDQDASPWEMTIDRFKEYFSELSSRAEDLMKGIKNSEIIRELDALIQDSMAELATHRDNFHNNLGPVAQETAEKAGRDLQRHTEKMLSHMAEARDSVAVYGRELHAVVGQNADDVSSRLNAYARKLRKRLSKDKQDINNKFEAYFGELQSRTSEHVNTVRTHVDPYLAQVRDHAAVKASSLNRLLKARADDVMDKMEDVAEDISDRFEDATQSLRSALAEKLAELQAWFQPYIDMFIN